MTGDVLPGPVFYTEGDELRQSMGQLMACLSEIEHRATTSWTESRPNEAQIYRLETHSTVKKALDLLRTIHELAPYVGGSRAIALKEQFDTAVEASASYRDDPTLANKRAMSSLVVDAIRNSFDLVMLGSAVDAAQERAVKVTGDAQREMEAQLSDSTKAIDALATTLRGEIDGASKNLRDEAERLLDEVSARGKETVARARSAVAGTLLNDAQTQFSSAQSWFNWQVTIWAALSVAAAAGFIKITWGFIAAQNLPATWTWQLAFYAGMRLVLLGGIAAVASFCVRMLKGQIALAQLNAHRTRVARSMPGLLEVAPEAERLPVLQSLIETIIGTKESVLADSSPESFLTTADALEKFIKAAKSVHD